MTNGLNNYINKYLRPLAEDTNGQYYSADDASQLSNIYKDIKKKIDIETDSDGDGISDYYEENMVMFNGVKLELDKNNADTDSDGIKDGDELSKFTYQYNSDGTMMNAVVSFTSNPTTQDSDYDGISDDLDSNPLSGELTGRMLGYYNANDAAYTMDYRDFFEDSTEYNNDLSTTSIVYADTVYNGCGFEYDDSSIGTITSITDLMELHGFENVENYKLSDYYSDDDLSEIGIGYHNVSYNNQDITVNVTVRGTDDSIEEWSSNVDIGNPVTWLSTYHKGFYTAEQRIMSYVEDYISDNASNMNDDVVYWVTGHSRGAAIANIICAELIDDNETVYGYTFAAPATTVSSTKNAAKYDSIFNIVNESDVVTYVPLPQWDFGVFGDEISLDAADYNSEFCYQTGESSYNAFSSNVLNIATNRLANNCASTWAEAFDYAGSQNISDEQYASISSRALRYCKITERKSIFGKHKGYKLYPSTMFVVQLGIEMYAGSDTEKENATEMFKELWNSKFTWALILLVGQSFFAGLPSNLDASTVAHGHAQATYYILSKH